MDKFRYYIDGPGELLVVHTDFSFTTPDIKKIIATSTCKGVTINAGATMEDVTGGRSIFPRRQYMTDRTATVEFSDCEMDFRYASLVSGEEIAAGAKTVYGFGEAWTFEVPATSPYTLTIPETPDAGTLTCRFIEAGTIVNVPSTGEAAAGAPTAAAKVVTFAAGDAGKKVEFNCTYQSSATTITTSLKVDSLPTAVKIIHKQPAFDGDNKIIGYQYVEFFKLQPSLEFNEDYQERAAYAPSMTFGILDPKRADQKVYDRIFVPTAA